jgi:hypothetical protein
MRFWSLIAQIVAIRRFFGDGMPVERPNVSCLFELRTNGPGDDPIE